MNLKNKKIVITGASSGIGRATAIYCAYLGAQIVLLGRNKHELNKTRSKMEGINHIVIEQDFNEVVEFDKLFDKMIEDRVKLDGFVHCAGVACVMPIKSLTRERLFKVMNINYYTFLDLARSFVKRKYSNECASILGISSSAVLHPRKFELGYIVSKAAMESSIPIMAQEFWNRKIRVNCISPGSVSTEMIESMLNQYGNKELLDDITSQSIIGWQNPEDISKACAFMLSDASKTITAQVIRVDGGII